MFSYKLTIKLSAPHPDVFWYPLNGIKWASKSQSKGHAFSFWPIIFLHNLEHLEYYIPSIGCSFGCFSSTGINLPHPITASVPPFFAGGQLSVLNFEMRRSQKNEFLGWGWGGDWERSCHGYLPWGAYYVCCLKKTFKTKIWLSGLNFTCRYYTVLAKQPINV